MGGILGCIFLWATLPNIDDPRTLLAAQSTVILDRNGIELYRLFSEQDRTYVPLTDISPAIQKATIAIEDERFFERGCFDAIGFTRAALSQVFPGLLVRSGGSTLTQQFAKNALIGRERTLVRKVRELFLACALENRYSKHELLELYLNWIPYGHNAYGIEQAAKNYFGTQAKNLTLAQASVLAALPQRPSYFNPYGKHVRTTLSKKAEELLLQGKKKSLEDLSESEVTIGLLGAMIGTGSTQMYVGGRTDQVLKNMEEQTMITQAEHEEALKELRSMTFAASRESIRAPHFVLWIEKQVQELLSIDSALLERGGFSITTTLDWRVQQVAEKIIAEHRDDLRQRFGAHNASLVTMEPYSREILAYVGNSDYNDEEHEGKIDMVRSPRQPGSSFKPFTYVAAFEQGYGPGSVIYDVPTKFGEDQPQNYDGTFWGVTSMRAALAGSRNIPAIKAFFLGGGEEKLLSAAQRMGVVTPKEEKEKRRLQNPQFDYGWPLSIGAAEVPLLEMVQGYATIADKGNYKSTTSILKVSDKRGGILYSAKSEDSLPVIDSRIAFLISSILSDKEARPKNDYWRNILSLPGIPAAAKTGTSNKCLERDEKGVCTLRRPESTWTIGYTPNLVTGVWVGNATSQSLYEKADGLTLAAPLWHDFMLGVYRVLKLPPKEFERPDGITTPLISRLSGKLASSCTPINYQATDFFLNEFSPTEEDVACARFTVDRVTHLLASTSCPKEAQEEGVFFLPQSELPNRWPDWETGVIEWAQKHMTLWSSTIDHSGSLLPLPLAPTEECDLAKTPGRLSVPSITILSPKEDGVLAYPSPRPRWNIESNNPIQEVRIAIDEKVIASFTEAPFSDAILVPKSITKEGVHTLTITVIDSFFNATTKKVQFTFGTDTLPPSLHITTPSEQEVINRTTLISIDAEDDSGIALLQFFIDGRLLTSRRDPPFTTLLPASIENGSHTLEIKAKDTAGNTATTSVQFFLQ